VHDGGTVNSPVGYIGYGGDGGVAGTGTVTVAGAGSTFTVGTAASTGELGIGVTEAGNGTVNIRDGGKVTVHGSARGAYFNGRGAINVTDTGSQLHVSDRLSLGGEFSDSTGTATLDVVSGGSVTVVGRAQLQNASRINLNAGGIMSVGGLDDGPRNGNGVVSLAAGTMLTLTDGTETFRGAINGAGALVKSGTGVQTLAGVNTYAGNTTVSAGTLRLAGNGSFAASPRITVGAGAAGSTAVLDVAGVTGGANFSNGGFALTANQTLTGNGTILGPVTIVNNAAIAPGVEGIGRLDLADATWNGGGRYVFQFNSLTPGAGTNNDFINSTGALNLAADAANPFIIDIRGVNFASPGTAPVGYTIATFGGGVNGFDPAAFAFPTTEWFSGTPTIAVQGNNLVLSFTPVPEPSSGWLACLGLAVLLGYKARIACGVLDKREPI
jgi:autotransporter-associated beta strand protein